MMKSLLNSRKPTRTASNKKKQLSIVLDKENIPPSETITPPIKRKQVALHSKTHSPKITKIRKANTNRNKKNSLKGLSHICKKDVITTNSKKQEEVKREQERSHNVVSPIITTNVDLISRRLKDNLTKATYNMVACLALSNQPQDRFIYERLFKSSNVMDYKKTLDNQSNLEILVSGAVTKPNTTTNNKNNNKNNHTIDVSPPPSFLKQEEIIGMFPTMNHSFDIEQENDFICTWLQHDTGGSEYSSSCIDSYDSFSIITEQELTDLMSQQDHNSSLFV